ncbi:MAG: hypothetical protein ABIO36_11000 [Pyrinomonadaceae bacterium]
MSEIRVGVSGWNSMEGHAAFDAVDLAEKVRARLTNGALSLFPN